MDRVLILNSRRWKCNPIEGIEGTKGKKMGQPTQYIYIYIYIYIYRGHGRIFINIFIYLLQCIYKLYSYYIRAM